MHPLGTGRLRTFVTSAGGSELLYDGIALMRFVAADDGSGPIVYVRDLDSGHFWTVNLVIGASVAEHFEGRFEPGFAVFRRRDGDVETTLEIAVSPENDVEVRRIGLTNNGQMPRRLEVTTYLEVMLDRVAEGSGPSTVLGVQTAYIPELQVLVAERGSADDASLAVAHALVPDDAAPREATFETYRARFIGRGRTLVHPRALTEDAPLSGTIGAVTDPVLVLRRRVEVAPGQRRTLTATLGVGATRSDALTAVFAGLAGARSWRVFQQAARAAGEGLREVGATGFP